MFRHVDFVQAHKCCGPQHLGLYEIHMPKHRNPQHITHKFLQKYKALEQKIVAFLSKKLTGS